MERKVGTVVRGIRGRSSIRAMTSPHSRQTPFWMPPAPEHLSCATGM